MPASGGQKPQHTGQPLQQSPKKAVAPIPNDPTIPDVYAEGVQMYVTYNSFSFVFNKGLGKPPDVLPVAVVRMSPQQAHLMMLILRKSLREYEKGVGEFKVPEQLLKSMEIEQETEGEL